jgi:hypothetical protein
MGLVPALTVKFMGYSRYLLVADVRFVYAYALRRMRHALWVIIGALACLQAWTMFRHVDNWWVG